MEVSAHKVRYQKQWHRFTKKVKRGLLLMQLFQLHVDKSEWLLPFDWDDVTRDYRPVSGDIKAKADQGIGQRAAVIDGADEMRRRYKHGEVDVLLSEYRQMVQRHGEEAARDWLLFKASELEAAEGPVPHEVLKQAEVTDLMSMRLDRQPVNLSVVPLGDLFGEQLHWKTTSIEKLDDGSLRMWKKQGREWRPVGGVLHGQQVRLGRWAKARGEVLNGVEAPKVTRETLGEYTVQRNAERKAEAIEAAMDEAIELVLMDQVPDVSVIGRGRPKWLWVCLSHLGDLHVSKALECWAGRCKVDSAVVVAAESKLAQRS